MMSVNMLRVSVSRRESGGVVNTPLLTIFFRDGTVFYAMYVLDSISIFISN